MRPPGSRCDATQNSGALSSVHTGQRQGLPVTHLPVRAVLHADVTGMIGAPRRTLTLTSQVKSHTPCRTSADPKPLSVSAPTPIPFRDAAQVHTGAAEGGTRAVRRGATPPTAPGTGNRSEQCLPVPQGSTWGGDTGSGTPSRGAWPTGRRTLSANTLPVRPRGAAAINVGEETPTGGRPRPLGGPLLAGWASPRRAVQGRPAVPAAAAPDSTSARRLPRPPPEG